MLVGLVRRLGVARRRLAGRSPPTVEQLGSTSRERLGLRLRRASSVRDDPLAAGDERQHERDADERDADASGPCPACACRTPG